MRSRSTDSTILQVLFCLTLFVYGTASIVEKDKQMRWNKWSWIVPQVPMEYYFRGKDTQQPNVIKAPAFECKCPPYKGW